VQEQRIERRMLEMNIFGFASAILGQWLRKEAAVVAAVLVWSQGGVISLGDG
jgi:hypothetical protein